MFLESILFLQKSQNFQKQCCPILATWLRVSLVACPQSWAYLENFHDSLANQSPSRKKCLENFSKSGFLGFSRLILATCSWMEALVARVTQKFSRLPLRLPREWNFQSWKTLRQNLQNFVLGVSRLVLATCLWLGLITKIYILLSAFPSFKTIVFTHKISIFSFTSSPIFKERYGFCFFLNIFYISCHILLGLCVSVDICVSDAWIWVFDLLMKLLCDLWWICCDTLCFECINVFL